MNHYLENQQSLAKQLIKREGMQLNVSTLNYVKTLIDAHYQSLKLIDILNRRNGKSSKLLKTEQKVLS